MATFYNQATLSYSGGTVNSNVTTGELLEVLSITKTAVVDEYTTGSCITYAINILNAGATPIDGLTLTDDLGATPFGTGTVTPLDYVDGSLKLFADGVLQPTPAVTDTAPLTITGISVPANGVATLLYTVNTNGFASPETGGSVTNNATLTGATTTISASDTVTAADAPDLAITKTLSPTTVTENGRLTYTFVISNYGNTAAVATDNLVITDTFDPVLSDLTVTLDGAAWTAPDDYTYDPATGLFTTVGEITVPAATFTQDPATGVFVTTPATVTLTVSGTV